MSDFLDKCDEMFVDYGVSQGDIKLKLHRYAHSDFHAKFRGCPAYSDEVFSKEKLYRELKREFKSTDRRQIRETRVYLMQVVAEAQNKGQEHTESFLDHFHEVSSALKNKGSIGDVERGRYLLQGLPKAVYKKVVKKCRVEIDDEATMKYDGIYKEAKALCQRYRAEKDLDEEL